MTARTRPRPGEPDNVWCVTCEAWHIPWIPVVTYCCADCGFGAWLPDTAEMHAIWHPDHIVYAAHHQTVDEPEADRRIEVQYGHIETVKPGPALPVFFDRKYAYDALSRSEGTQVYRRVVTRSVTVWTVDAIQFTVP